MTKPKFLFEAYAKLDLSGVYPPSGLVNPLVLIDLPLV